MDSSLRIIIIIYKLPIYLPLACLESKPPMATLIPDDQTGRVYIMVAPLTKKSHKLKLRSCSILRSGVARTDIRR